MTYTEPLFNQISRFVTSIGFGFLICILYFVLFFIRKIISDKRWAVITQDVVFGIMGTVMSFFYMVIYNNGEVRLNLIAGEIIGGLVLYFTSGRYVTKLLKKTAELLRKALSVLFLPLKIYFKSFKSIFVTLKQKMKKRRENQVKGMCEGDMKQAKESRKIKIKKNHGKRKNINPKPLKNQNKSV